MDRPHKLTIEITGDGYSQTLTDEDGKVLYQTVHEMTSPGSSKRVQGEDPFDTSFFIDDEELFGNLGDAIDGLSFGPFGVAQALHEMN